MVSYLPMQHLMLEKGLKKMEVCDACGLSRSTWSKIMHNQYVALEVLERICLELDCQIGDVVRIEKNDQGV